MNIKLIVVLSLVMLSAVFVVQNADVVEIRFLFWSMAMSRALMFIFLTLLGIAVGWLLHGHFSHKAQNESGGD